MEYKNKPASEDTIRLIIKGELEDFIKSQTYFFNGYCHVYVGGWRFERNEEDPEHEYRFASDETMRIVKDHFKSELADPFKDMKLVFFINYNNGHEKTYTLFDIDKDFYDIDWKEFINKEIPYYRITGATVYDFQKALQLHGIVFIMKHTMNQEGYDKWMSVEWNKNNIKTLEHSNIGNY